MPGRDSAPARSVFRLSIGRRLLTLLGALLVSGISAAMAVAAVFFLVLQQWALGALILAPLATLMRVELEADALVLDLPAGRSLIHRPAAQHAKVPYGDIEAIESRLEAYRTLGLTMLQRSYVLRRKNGPLIFLFEDRAIGTLLRSSIFTKIAADIAARAGAPLRNLGMVEGRGGFLAVWGAQAPDWAAAELPMARQARIWRNAQITGTLAIVVIVFALLLRLLTG
jgi:hypothetical protein